MRKAYLALGGALVLSSAIAVAAMQEETPAAPAPSPEATVSEPVVQDIGRDAAPAVSLPRNLPSLEELERMSDDEFEELFDLKPKADIPAAARRSLRAVGLLAEGEGGLEAAALGPQPAALVEAALRGNRGRLVSRWGHIVLRRALASRLAAPEGMDPVDFAAMRTALLVRMGEGQVARGLAQQVDNIAYDTAMTAAAFDAFVATGDVVGACPMLEIVSPYDAEDPRIKVTRDICGAYSGRSAAALRQLERKRQQGVLSRTEMLLAQRYAGAGGSTRRAVNIEWDGTDELTPFAYSLAVATGLDVPDSLRAGAGRYYAMVDATSPALALDDRASSSWFAAANGVLSSQAMVDLLSIAYGTGDTGTVLADRAEVLRRAYVAADPEERMSALRTLWSADVNAPYGTRVATAYAAARMPVDEAFADDGDELVAAMLAAGLDRNALRWTGVVENGSKAWAMLALVNPQRDAVSVGEVGDSDHATRLFVAGLAGLGRASDGVARDYDIDLARQTRWTRAISGAADSGSAPLVALLAGLGMQGDSWAKMTPLHLYHIVRALDRVGLSAEARMIAAEAVARG
ncbi:hypothetical protein T8S45_04870 [Blastomonas marina]|uniref:hypothetical protein n=1 Tax=Blastomonas marina TaxID=1867408 RepID=UPI002AC94AD2|nr:hypothetical protein [Blastomonas marina]WPZ04873.1 hypothetical protein T8S45_04870 [Blastomonas marina]